MQIEISEFDFGLSSWEFSLGFVKGRWNLWRPNSWTL
jgi:hypothetical protein